MRRIVSFLFLAGFVGVVSAEQLRVDVALIHVVATVLDDRGRHVSDLTADDFVLYEDGEPQTIEHFEQSNDLPASVGILLDTSGSMESKIDTATVAVERFLRQIHEDDEIFLVTFDDRPRLVQSFTDDRSELVDALRRVRVGGGTALYDAVALGVRQLEDATHDKRALLLITDGEDTSSGASRDRVERDIRESETLVYALGIAPEMSSFGGPGGGTPTTFPGAGGPTGIPFPGGIPRFPTGGTTRQGSSDDTLNMGVLERFSQISGGEAWQVSGLSSNTRRTRIADALGEIADELRNQYTIGYYPPHSVDDGEWHAIRIDTRIRNTTVRHREGYFGGRE